MKTFDLTNAFFQKLILEKRATTPSKNFAKRYYLLVGIIFFFLSYSLSGQSLKTANSYFERSAFTKAIQAYETLLGNSKYNEKEHREILQNLALSYKSIQDSENAEKTYKKLLRFLDDPTPEIYLQFAQVLACNKKYNESANYYKLYAQVQNNDTRGMSFYEAYQNVYQFSKDSALYSVESAFFNSEFSDFSPMYYKNGLVFCSSRDNLVNQKSEYDQTAYLNLYYVSLNKETKIENFIWNKLYDKPDYTVDLFSKNLTSKLNDGPLTFSNNENQLIVTRNSKNNNKKLYRLKLFSSYFDPKQNDWTSLEELPFNNDDYSCEHPAFTPNNERLYFISDMPGGFGGTDVYFIEYKNQKWGSPQNLGPKINTEGDEKFPFIDAQGNLYFSSDGLAGIGGLDIFYAKIGEDGTPIDFPKNLGIPFNSPKDDFGYICDATNEFGYLSSNRKRGFYDDDIYAFRKNCKDYRIMVYDFETKKQLGNVNLSVSKNNEIQYFSQKGEEPFSVCIDRPSDYQFAIKKEGYVVKSFSFSDNIKDRNITFFVEKEQVKNLYNDVSNTQNSELVSSETPLEQRNIQKKVKKETNKKLPQSVTDLINNSVINFSYGQSSIRQDQEAKLDKIVKILKKYPSIKLEVCSHTDLRSSKEFNQKLSEERAAAVIAYLIKNNVTPQQLVPVGQGEDNPYIRCDAECPEIFHEKNRRTDFKIIAYN
ncbi:MAG: OmpA family protein [Emticicia sp.]